MEYLFGLTPHAYYPLFSRMQDLLEQLRTRAHAAPKTRALLDFNAHDCIFIPDELTLLSRTQLQTLLDRNQSEDLLPANHRIRVPYPRSFWQSVCRDLRLARSNIQEIEQAMSSLSYPIHPYVLAGHFYRFCLKQGLLDILKTRRTNHELFSIYRVLCSRGGYAVAIPFADLNWRRGLNPDALCYERLAMAYNPALRDYSFCILNQDTGHKTIDFKLDPLVLYYGVTDSP